MSLGRRQIFILKIGVKIGKVSPVANTASKKPTNHKADRGIAFSITELSFRF
jgi:hypothetical protein